METNIIKLNPENISDFLELIQVFNIVFEWENFKMPIITHLEKMLESPNFLVFVVKEYEQVVGGLTAHVLDRYDSERPSAYLYDLAILESYQRQGKGKNLIAALNIYCKENNFSEVFVQAETEDGHAVNFYRSTSVTSELHALHFTYSF